MRKVSAARTHRKRRPEICWCQDEKSVANWHCAGRHRRRNAPNSPIPRAAVARLGIRRQRPRHLKSLVVGRGAIRFDVPSWRRMNNSAATIVAAIDRSARSLRRSPRRRRTRLILTPRTPAVVLLHQPQQPATATNSNAWFTPGRGVALRRSRRARWAKGISGIAPRTVWVAECDSEGVSGSRRRR